MCQLKRNKIVVVCHQGLGDLLMNIPLIRGCLSALEPDGHLILLVKSEMEKKAVLSLWHGETRIEVWSCGLGLFRWGKMLKYAFALRKQKIDILFSTVMRDIFTNALWIYFVNANRSIGTGEKWIKFVVHNALCDENSECMIHKTLVAVKALESVKFNIPINAFGFPIPIVEMQTARQLVSTYHSVSRWIAFGPGSEETQKWKRWPIEYYIELGNSLMEKYGDLGIILCGTNNELALNRTIYDKLPHDRCLLPVNLSFNECRALLEQCLCIVCACSGISHIASTVEKLNIIGLYGPTNPLRTGPLTQRLRVITAGLQCSPCYDDNSSTSVVVCEKFSCMNEIRVQFVVEEIDRILLRAMNLSHC